MAIYRIQRGDEVYEIESEAEMTPQALQQLGQSYFKGQEAPSGEGLRTVQPGAKLGLEVGAAAPTPERKPQYRPSGFRVGEYFDGGGALRD